MKSFWRRSGIRYRHSNDYYRFEGWEGVIALVVTLFLVGYSIYSYFGR